MTSERIPPIHCHGDILAGRYRLLRPLAEGGMGSVWRARSLSLDVDVAVKVVKRSVSSPEACERLLREARAAASLGHASIVRVLDFGTTDDGEPFLVMQLLHGKTLGSWLRERGKLPAITAVQLLLPIASALAEVHGLGIVHRDVKPENILFEEGQGGQLVPKLVDFGIAKQSHDNQSVFTASGVLMGSPSYMSPEQARGDPQIGPRSDIWSLCVVLYEMITGKRPFEGSNHGAILFSVFSQSPEPAHLLGGGDGALWEILQKGLAKNHAERWQSMRQLGRALAVWMAAKGVTADAAGTSLEHHWLGERDSFDTPDVGQRTTEVPRSPSRAPSADPTDHVHTLASSPSSASPSEVELALPGLPTRSRAQVVGLGLALLVISGILTFLSLAKEPRADAALAFPEVRAVSVAAGPVPAAAPVPAATPTLALSVTTLAIPVVDAGADAAAAETGRAPAPAAPGRRPRTSGRAAPISPLGGSTNRPMPLPSGPDF